ncbi:MAG: hypothetical protein CSA07_01520 [Bacteroidia bacterium]|nr:MAG: hypothetical protein CSA07_01520 [Bacteroidia bacterium]
MSRTTLQRALEMVWAALACICFYLSYRIMGAQPTRGWVFLGMGAYASLMVALRVCFRRSRQNRNREEGLQDG